MKTRISLLLAIVLTNASFAQTNLYNEGVLQLSSSSDILYISGNLTNTSTASLTNNGNLYVLKDIANSQSLMSPGTGILRLSGNAMQTIGGTQPFKTFDLVSNNSNGIILNSNLSISGTHTFANGVITTSNTPNFLIYEAGAGYTGSDDAKHVNGWVKKNGATNFTFPVGNGVYLRPCAIENLSASSEFDARYNAPTPNNNQMQYPLLSIDVYEYWEINKVSGGSAAVHLNWDNTKTTFPCYIMGDMAVSYYNGSEWTDQGGSASGDVTTTGDITSSPVSSFGYFAIGSRSFPLPLKFLSFEAQKKQDHVELIWVTAEEMNTDHFEIERSNNGTQFITLAKMPTTNRYNVQEYRFKDFSYSNGTVFYRIRCVDRDGKNKFSRIISVSENTFNETNVRVLNPVGKEIIIRSKTDDLEPTAYILYDQAGRTILKGSLKLKGGVDNTIRLSFNPVKGIYFLKLFRTHLYSIEKLVIN